MVNTTMRRLLPFLLTSSALVASPALAQFQQQPNPFGSPFGFSAPAAASYPFPAIVTLDQIGDSRVSNGLGLASTASTLSNTTSITLGFPGWWIFASGNNWLPNNNSARGIGSSTTQSLRDRVVGGAISNSDGKTVGTFSQTAGTGTETLASVGTTTGGFPGYLTPGSLIPGSYGSVTVTFGTAGSVGASCGAGSGYTPFTLSDSNGDTFPNPSGCVQDAFNATRTYGSILATNAVNTPTSVIGDGTTTVASWSGFAYTYPVGGTVFVDGMGSNALNGPRTVTASTANSVSFLSTYNGTVGVTGVIAARSPYANFTITQPASGTRAQAGDTFTITTFGPQLRAVSVSQTAVNNPVDGQFDNTTLGITSPAGSAAQGVAMLDSVNDGSAVFNNLAGGVAYGQCPGPDYAATFPTMINGTSCHSMVNIAAALDTYGAAGKVVFLADEIPTGISTAQLESHVVTANSATISATNGTGKYLYDGNEYSGSATADGTSIPNTPGLIATWSAITLTGATVTGSGAGATITFSWSSPSVTFNVGTVISVSGITPTGLNGAFTVTSATATSVTVAAPNASGTYTSGGSLYAYFVYTPCSPIRSCSPAAGQYAVNSSGVYLISTSDPFYTTGGNAYLSYSYYKTAGTTDAPTTQKIMHGWLRSREANYSWQGTSYNFPGALYNRPYVVSIPLFNSLVDTRSGNSDMAADPKCESHPCLPVPAAFDSIGPHPTVFGGNLSVGAVRNALAGVPIYASQPDNTRLSKYGNIRCGKGGGAPVTISCTMPPSMQDSAVGHPPVELEYEIGSTWYKVTESGGTFTGTGINSGSTTVNYATGAVSIVFSGSPTNNSSVALFEDDENRLLNPMLETGAYGYASDIVAPCSGTVAGTGFTNMPAGWQCTATNSTGLTIVWTSETNAGIPTIVATITGVATAAGNLKFQPLQSGYPTDVVGSSLAFPLTQQVRANMHTLVAPVNSHIINAYGPKLTAQAAWSTQTVPNLYTATGNTTALTSLTTVAASSGGMSTTSAFSYGDLNLGIAGQSSGVNFNHVTPLLDWSLHSPTGSFLYSYEIDWTAGPVSMVIKASQAGYKIWH